MLERSAPFVRRRDSARRTGRPAFTLVELMISVFLVLLLLIGVNKVFTITAETAGTTNAVADAMRDIRGTQRTLQTDLEKIVPPEEQPMILLHSERQAAFRNAADLQGAVDPTNPMIDADPNAKGANLTYAQTTYNHRNHRLDTFSTFVRNIDVPYRRQTGNGAGTFSSATTSTEAWIWYGHLWLADNSGATSDVTYPGQGASPAQNPRNFFATQWPLGRVTMLLKPEGQITATEMFVPRVGAPSPTNLTPFAYGSGTAAKSGATPTPARPQIQESFVDLAGIDIAAFHAVLQPIATTPTATWWTQLVHGDKSSPINNLPPTYRFQADPTGINQPVTNAGPFTSSPALQTAPSAGSLAKNTPVFVSGCTQFMVEYAGDFVTQDALGNVTAAAPDGKIDFQVDSSVAPATSRIRWYGFPRDISGSGVGGPDGKIDKLHDVVPLRDVAGAAASFEKELPIASPPPDYAAPTIGQLRHYCCAWGPAELATDAVVTSPRAGSSIAGPALIRFVIEVTDPTGRLANGQTIEYTFTLEPPKTGC